MTTDIQWTQGSPEEFRKKLTDPQLVGGPARRFLTKAVVLLQRLARQRAPKDTGHLAQSITYAVQSAPMPIWGKVGTNTGYGPAMEYGTNALSEKPSMTGAVPFPTGPELETWAKRHGFPNGYIVAAIIKNRGGLKPRRFLRGAFAAGKAQIKTFLLEMGKDIERGWGN